MWGLLDLCDPSLLELFDPSMEDAVAVSKPVVRAPTKIEAVPGRSLRRTILAALDAHPEELPLVPCFDDEDYDPRKPEYIRPASEEEVQLGNLAQLTMQISRLETFRIARPNEVSASVGRHYDSVLAEMKAQLRAGLSVLPQRSHSFPKIEAAPCGRAATAGSANTGRRERACSAPSELELEADDALGFPDVMSEDLSASLAALPFRCPLPPKKRPLPSVTAGVVCCFPGGHKDDHSTLLRCSVDAFATVVAANLGYAPFADALGTEWNEGL